MKKIIPFALCAVIHFAYSQPTELSLRLQNGSTYHQHVASDMAIDQEINGQKLDIKMTVEGSMAYLVKNITSSGFDLEVRYTDLTMTIALPQGNMSFSSDKQDENDLFSSVLGEMIKTPFNVKLSKTGRVESVAGIDKMFENAFQKFLQLDAQQLAQLKAQLMQAYGEEAFKGNIEMATAIFPENKVSKGDKWIVESNIESGFAAKLTTSFEFQGEQGDQFLIHGNSTLKTADKDAYIEANGVPMRYDLEGTMTSDIKINKETGWISEAKIHQKIQGKAQVKESDQMPDGMTIPMVIVNQMSITD